VCLTVPLIGPRQVRDDRQAGPEGPSVFVVADGRRAQRTFQDDPRRARLKDQQRELVAEMGPGRVMSFDRQGVQTGKSAERVQHPRRLRAPAEPNHEPHRLRDGVVDRRAGDPGRSARRRRPPRTL
jgi:hypothetical protein